MASTGASLDFVLPALKTDVHNALDRVPIPGLPTILLPMQGVPVLAVLVQTGDQRDWPEKC